MDSKQRYEVSSGIWNVLLKTESMSTLSIQGGLSRKSSIPDERNPSHPVFKMFYSKNIKERSSGMYYWRQRACRHCRYKVVWVENLQYRMKGIHPIRYSKCSTQKILKKGHPECTIEDREHGRHCRYKVVWVENLQYWMKRNPSHPVFEMFYSKNIKERSSGNVLLKTESMSTLSIQGGSNHKHQYQQCWQT